MAASERIKHNLSVPTRFLGRQRSTVGLLAMVVLLGMGERMAERFLPIYILAFAFGVVGTIGFAIFGRDMQSGVHS